MAAARIRVRPATSKKLAALPDHLHYAVWHERGPLEPMLDDLTSGLYPLGARLQVWSVAWQETLWYILSFPAADLAPVTHIAKKHGLFLKEKCLPVHVGDPRLPPAAGVFNALQPENYKHWEVLAEFPIKGLTGTLEER